MTAKTHYAGLEDATNQDTFITKMTATYGDLLQQIHELASATATDHHSNFLSLYMSAQDQRASTPSQPAPPLRAPEPLDRIVAQHERPQTRQAVATPLSCAEPPRNREHGHNLGPGGDPHSWATLSNSLSHPHS